MQYVEYNHRLGKEKLRFSKPHLFTEITQVLASLPPFPHGSKKGKTPKELIEAAFVEKGWTRERAFVLSKGKQDFVDLYKDSVAIEMEWSRFEMFFRDFFRFILLAQKKEIIVGVVITYGEMAYKNWGLEAPSYRSARASLERLVDFLQGDYHSVVKVPIWCIGIE